MKKIIFVITATYTAAGVLPCLLESLRAQTDRNFEWVMIDGASIAATIDQQVLPCILSLPAIG